MKQRAKNALKNPLIYGSIVVIFGGLLANFINFLFNLYMSRSLTVADYGVLASIISLLGFPALLANAINPVVVRFAGDYFVKGEYAYLRGLYIKFMKFFLLVGGIFLMLFLVNISSISNFFHISDHNILILAGMIMFLSFIWTINMAFIQAKLAFGFGVLVSFISACLKLLLGFIFILLGYSVSGAVGAMLLAALGSYLISFIPLKFIFYKKTKTIIIDSKEIMSYAVPSALTMFGLTSFISIDILLVKHLFDPVQAGLYAGLSLVGRIIFFIVAPIGTVMFPIIVRKHTHNESITNTFKASLLMVVLPALFISGFYFIFPEFAILFILKKTEYLEVAGLLGFFGLYISLYCILYLLAMFFLSIKKTRVYYPILSGAILQVALIYNFHESFLQVIIISFVIVLLLVVGFLLYYPYATKK